MRSQGKSALRMIRRSEVAELPDAFRQNIVDEISAFAPPDVPELPLIGGAIACAKFIGEQAANAKKLCLPCADIAFTHDRQQFRHAAHRPDILFVSESPKESFPQCLFPAGLPG